MFYKTVLTTLAFALLLTACPGEKKVGSEKIIESIVSAMCKKMATCQPNAMPSEEFCQNTMKAALAGNKDLPKVEASQKALDGCIASIDKTECDKLMGSKPPEGCEFLQ